MKLASKVIIFGVLDTAELAHWYLENDSPYTVAAFTINKEYIKEDTFKGLPVVSFEELEQHYPPSEYRLFAPMTGVKMNTLRKKIYEEGKAKGYDFISYVSSKATVCDNELGENCFILEDSEACLDHFHELFTLWESLEGSLGSIELELLEVLK